MSAEAAHNWADQALAWLLVGVASLLVLIAGLAILFILPAGLIIVAMGYDVGPASTAGNWLFFLWFPLAFAGAFYLIVAGLEAVNEPRLGIVSRMCGVVLLVFFTFPPFLFPPS